MKIALRALSIAVIRVVYAFPMHIGQENSACARGHVNSGLLSASSSTETKLLLPIEGENQCHS